MRPFRSLLFVPGHKGSWVDKAVASGVDAVILDLEDSVPPAEKEAARRQVAESIARLAGSAARTGVLVRPNPADTAEFAADLDAVVGPGLEALLLPKVNSRDDLLAVDAVLGFLEMRRGLQVGAVELVPSLETARANAAAEELARAVPRVASLQAATARDGDIAREVGFTWTAEGMETLFMRSQAVLKCRAAGLTHPLCGVWQDLEDRAGLEAFARQNRGLGFRGQLVIHPSHVGVVNEVYSVSPEELERCYRLVEAYEAGAAEGSAAVRFEGEHIDIAHVKTARSIIEFSQAQKRGES